MTAPRIRGLAEPDLPAVAAMVAALNAEEGYDRGTAPDAAALRAAFLGDVPTGRLLVAEGADGPLGYLTLHTTYETEFAQRGCYMGDLYVMPAARRCGLARALVAAAARAVRAAGGTFLWWTALPTNAGGQAFYRAIGAQGETLLAYALTDTAFARLAGDDAP
jgi:ribosomal protein S18 acetylase RimI-like enzyme